MVIINCLISRTFDVVLYSCIQDFGCGYDWISSYPGYFAFRGSFAAVLTGPVSSRPLNTRTQEERQPQGLKQLV